MAYSLHYTFIQLTRLLVFAGDARSSYDVVETFDLSSLSKFNNSYRYLLITTRSVIGHGGKRRAVFGKGRRRRTIAAAR